MGLVQLICYPDSMGGTLDTLNTLLTGSLKGLFPGGVHILPPYPSSGDRGFAPISYTTIDPKFGSWNDIKEIGRNLPVVLDLMVNHISRRSRYFQDFLDNGFASRYHDMFITKQKIWGQEEPHTEDLQKIFLRRKSPFSIYSVGNEQQEVAIWTTFGSTDPSEQIDLDIHSDVTKAFLMDLLENYHNHGVASLRLDAVGYVVKKKGSSCFFVEPEIFEFLAWISQCAKKFNMSILPEVHASLETQHKLANRGYLSYDFASPFLILDALTNHCTTYLVDYLRSRPANMVTMLDCHDGIPVYPDVLGLLPEESIGKTIQTVSKYGANFSRLLSADQNGGEIDVHQINCTYFSALGCNEKAFMAARAIQLFLPGIPQIYYIGLLAGTNSSLALEEQQDGRAINRKNYSLPEILEYLKLPLVQKQLELIRLRNEHPAFKGDYTIDGQDDELRVLWNNKEHSCSLHVLTKTHEIRIEYTNQHQDGAIDTKFSTF